MSHTQNVRRFKANPVEVLVLSSVSFVFAWSVYNLFYEHSGFQPVLLSTQRSAKAYEGREPASVSRLLATLQVPCDTPDLSMNVSASKVRLDGSLCGGEASQDSPITTSSIRNLTNQTEATVFVDSENHRFSTDYMTLNTGLNQIQVEFTYPDGKVLSQKVDVVYTETGKI